MEHLVGWGEIVAEWWVSALLSDIVDIESWGDWETENGGHSNLALLDSDWPDTRFDQELASLEDSIKDNRGGLRDELVLEGEGVVLWVLEVWVDETVSNGKTLESKFKVSLVLKNEVVGDGWDIVSGVALTSDVEVSTLELWVLLEESFHELGHVVSDFFFVSVQVSGSSVRKSSSNWLVNVDHVSPLIPGGWVRLKRDTVGLESVWSVLVEHGDLRSASWSSSEPHDKWSSRCSVS